MVTPSFPPSALGGVSTHVDLIAKGLTENGHKVSVATTNRFDHRRVMNFSGLREFEGLQVYYAKARWPGRYFLAPKVMRVLRMWIPTFDVVHVHDTRTFVGLAAYLVARDVEIPYVLTPHGSVSIHIGDTTLKTLHDRILGKGLVLNASRVIAVSSKEVQDLVRFGIPSGRITLVPNALPFDEGLLQERFAPRGDGHHHRRTVLFLGRLHPIKGIDRLITAFGLVHRRNEAVRLVIVGEDFGARTGLNQLVRQLSLEGAVEFRGPASGLEKRQLLFDADVLVLPSYSEVFGLVILEAFAASLPVVVTSGCSIADDLERARAALIVESVPEMAEAIERCLRDEELANALRAGGIALLRTTYNWQGALARLEQVYRGAMESRSH